MTQREIKFRAWDDRAKKWREGDLIHRDDCVTIARTLPDSAFSNHEYYDCDPSTVGQFTGLHDCNGTPVYEGDVVNFTFWWFDGDYRDTNLCGDVVYICRINSASD